MSNPTPFERALSALRAAYECEVTAPGGLDVHWRNALCAALESLQEPSVAMMAAAARTPGMEEVTGCIGMAWVHGVKISNEHSGDNTPLHQAWRAMLHELIKTGGPE